MAAAAPPRIETYSDFIKVHELLLTASSIPPSLHHQLFQKLTNDTFDGGNFFQVEPVEENNGRQRKLTLISESMPKESHLFLIDHAWTFRLSDARKQVIDEILQYIPNFKGQCISPDSIIQYIRDLLLEIPGLAERMASLMCVDIDLASDSEETNLASGDMNGNHTNGDIFALLQSEINKQGEKGANGVLWLELDELGIDDDMLQSLNLCGKFPNLVALSLCGNKLENVETIMQEVTGFNTLRALWLNENPVLHKFDVQMEDKILRAVPSLEIYNSHFTNNYGDWALGFCGGMHGKDSFASIVHHSLENITSLDLSDRCIHDLSSKAFSPFKMPFLSYLNLRGNPMDQNSVDELLNLLKGFSGLQALEVDIPGPLGRSAVEIIEALPNLSQLNGVPASKVLETRMHVIDAILQPRLPEIDPNDPLADRVISAMWLYLMTYRLANEEKIDETSVWYVMDELGSALRHSDVPNFRVSPFLYMPQGNLASAVSFSVLWPTDNVYKGDECTRDFLFGIGEDKQRSARLTAWFHTPQQFFIQEFKKYCERPTLASSVTVPQCVEPSSTTSLIKADARVLRVYTDLPQVDEFLTHPEFVLTNEPKDADIIWTCMQVDEDVKKAIGVTEDQYINQFPFEACLVMKHHLAETVRKAQGCPDWIQPTYNLESHLSQLIGDYTVRSRDGLNNLWILKPWNMARTIDTTVTSDLSAIIRLMETGPKICQKYIEHPALFQGKKFDLRYIVLVRSMNPLEIFVADVFWCRLANNPYSLDKSTLFEYETHFTVMNYIGRLNHMNTPEFVLEFEKEHKVKWSDIHQRIRKMIRAVFESAATVHPEMHCGTSRAIYGVDVMLDSFFQPKLLEVTYCPDCTRACKYDTKAFGSDEVVKGRDFFNFIFGCLFLNETTHCNSHLNDANSLAKM